MVSLPAHGTVFNYPDYRPQMPQNLDRAVINLPLTITGKVAKLLRGCYEKYSCGESTEVVSIDNRQWLRCCIYGKPNRQGRALMGLAGRECMHDHYEMASSAPAVVSREAPKPAQMQRIVGRDSLDRRSGGGTVGHKPVRAVYLHSRCTIT